MSAPARPAGETAKRTSNQESSGSLGGRGGRSYYRRNNNNPGRYRGDQVNNQARDGDHRDKRQQENRDVDMRKYHKMIADAHNNFADIVQTENVKEDCTICCKSNDMFGVGQCRHPVCIECAIRLRIICAQSTCPVCRAEIEEMCFMSAKGGLSTIDLNFPKTAHPDEERYKIRFQNPAAGERYEKYLAHVCKICNMEEGERKEFPSFVSLRQHMSQVHQLSFCHICTDNINLFSRERKTYTREQLQRHIKQGDPEDKSQKGHPSCLFCEQRFFDEELRYRHLRKDHFFCQFCEAEGVAMNTFYGKHLALIDHYVEKHFVCDVPECKNAGIAFSNSLDLKLHKAKDHGNGRQGLAIDFPVAGRQLGGRGRGRGGQMNREVEERVNLPPPTRGVIVVPAEPVQQPQSDRSEFVVVPSAQHRGPIRFNTLPAYDMTANREQFPTLPGTSRGGGPVRANYPYTSKSQQSAANKGPTPSQGEAFPTLGSSGNISSKGPNEQWGRHTGQFEVIDQDLPRARSGPEPTGTSGASVPQQQHQVKIQTAKKPTEDFPGLPINVATQSQNYAKAKNWASKVAATTQSSSGSLITHAQPSQQKKKKNKSKKRQEPYESPEYIEPPEPEWEEVPTKVKPVKSKTKKSEKNQIVDVIVPTGFAALNRGRDLNSSEEESSSEEERKTIDGPKSMSEIGRLVNNNDEPKGLSLLTPKNEKPKAEVKAAKKPKEEISSRAIPPKSSTPQEPSTGLFGPTLNFELASTYFVYLFLNLMFSISGVLSNLASGFSRSSAVTEPPPGLGSSSNGPSFSNDSTPATPTSNPSNGLSYGPPPGFESVVPKSARDALIPPTDPALLASSTISTKGKKK